MSGPMEKVVAVGAGRMGRGIGQVVAYAGYPVAIVDMKPRKPADARRLQDEARAEITANLEFLVSLKVMTKAQARASVARIDFASADRAAELIGDADVIFEGVPELMEPKREALGRMSALARPDAIIASTTSTMLVNTLAEFVGRPDRFLNAHWLNPAYLIPLVEVSPGDRTSPEVVERMMTLLRRIGKIPVKCKASPGYIVPRIQSVAMSEAVRLFEEGVGTAEDIDRALQVGFGLRYATMGMLEFLDWGGVDILYYANNYLRGALNSERYAVPDLIPKLMAEGKKGMREGQGVYDFRKIDVQAFQREKLTRFVRLLRALDLLPEPAAGAPARKAVRPKASAAAARTKKAAPGRPSKRTDAAAKPKAKRVKAPLKKRAKAAPKRSGRAAARSGPGSASRVRRRS